MSALDLTGAGWNWLARGEGLTLLEAALPEWLPRQRWFGAKTKIIASIRVLHWIALPVTASESLHHGGLSALPPAIFIIEVGYTTGEPDTYQIPLAISAGREWQSMGSTSQQSILVTLDAPSGPVMLHDATVREGFRQALLQFIAAGTSVSLQSQHEATADDKLSARPSAVFAGTRPAGPMRARTGSAEQSNTSILYADKMILKLFRRLEPGENPDIEIGRFLTEVAHFPRIAPFLGEISLTTGSRQTSIAMLQGLVANEGDGWQWTLDALSQFYKSLAACSPPTDDGSPAAWTEEKDIPAEARERIGKYLEAAALLGTRTGEMHVALATETRDEAFQPQPITASDLSTDARRIEDQLRDTLEALRLRASSLDNETLENAATLLSQGAELLERAQAIAAATPSGLRIRIHGDYHLGQILHLGNALSAKDDFVLLDFEGEPARPLVERRRKQCPLKDVAGMLRSFSYASYAALDQYVRVNPGTRQALEPWARLWQNAVSTEFLRAYRRAAEVRGHVLPEPAQANALLNAYLLEKALYELLYELNNRPAWVRIPLAGILALPQTARHTAAAD